MTATARRLVVFAGATPNPRVEKRTLVEGVVAVRLDPALILYTDDNVNPNPDFWDVLVDPFFDHSSYVVLYEAELQSDNSIVVKRDLFGPGDYPHSWAGWPVPGDPPPDAPPGAMGVMPTRLLTKDEQKALALVRKYRAAKA